ncbi:RNA polymerase sigma factor [Geojedonia litorea]|uniref:RNA polymerase sigma factor n=1 Tax=Geojedonia litorea TaxID=1268269 RepID=A0ABV9N1E2_9FLAO
MSKSDTAQLLTLIRRRDLTVLDKIYRENRSAFLNFAKQYKLPEQDYLDIYQDAIIAFYENVVSEKVQTLDSSIKTYLFSIGKFMIYKKINDYKYNKPIEQEMNAVLQKQIEYYEYHEVSESDYQKLVLKCFGQLGKKCQKMLKLFYYEKFTLEEIKTYLNYDNYNVVKSQKSRCLKTLKDLITKQKQNG